MLSWPRPRPFFLVSSMQLLALHQPLLQPLQRWPPAMDLYRSAQPWRISSGCVKSRPLLIPAPPSLPFASLLALSRPSAETHHVVCCPPAARLRPRCWRSSCSYGLFRRMTGVGDPGGIGARVSRPEVELQGSVDGGQTWHPYVFKYKPGPVDRPPPWVAPHQPRSAALSPRPPSPPSLPSPPPPPPPPTPFAAVPPSHVLRREGVCL